jgi:hypothetical protein
VRRPFCALKDQDLAYANANREMNCTMRCTWLHSSVLSPHEGYQRVKKKTGWRGADAARTRDKGCTLHYALYLAAAIAASLSEIA